MKASEARAMADEKSYFRQIRAEAMTGKTVTTLEFISREFADQARLHLTSLGYECGKIKEHKDSFGDDYLFHVSW